MIFIVALFLVTVAVQGKPPLEVSPTSTPDDLFYKGVDLESCNNIVFEVKKCEAHHMYLLGRDGTHLVRFIIGGWSNTKSSLKIVPTGSLIFSSKRLLLKCDEFRWFWISFNGSLVRFGRGRRPGENVFLNNLDPVVRQVKRIALSKSDNIASTIRLGDTERDRFTRVLQEGKFSDGMISETSTSRKTCVTLCSEHDNCGMFSYNQGLGLCAIFDRMTSSFNVTSEEGWRSWKLLYCNP